MGREEGEGGELEGEKVGVMEDGRKRLAGSCAAQ